MSYSSICLCFLTCLQWIWIILVIRKKKCGLKKFFANLGNLLDWPILVYLGQDDLNLPYFHVPQFCFSSSRTACQFKIVNSLLSVLIYVVWHLTYFPGEGSTTNHDDNPSKKTLATLRISKQKSQAGFISKYIKDEHWHAKKIKLCLLFIWIYLSTQPILIS